MSKVKSEAFFTKQLASINFVLISSGKTKFSIASCWTNKSVKNCNRSNHLRVSACSFADKLPLSGQVEVICPSGGSSCPSRSARSRLLLGGGWRTSLLRRPSTVSGELHADSGRFSSAIAEVSWRLAQPDRPCPAVGEWRVRGAASEVDRDVPGPPGLGSDQGEWLQTVSQVETGSFGGKRQAGQGTQRSGLRTSSIASIFKQGKWGRLGRKATKHHRPGLVTHWIIFSSQPLL